MNTQLQEAIAARTEAAAELRRRAEITTRARQAAADAQARVGKRAAERAAWIERDSRKVEAHFVDGRNGPAPVLVADAKAVQALMTDEANAAATAAALQRIEAAEHEARDALAAADATVREASREELFAQVRAEFESFRRQASELAATREWLFAAFLSAGRSALKPQDWLLLDTEIGCASELMQVGIPWTEVPINELELTGGRDRPAEARRRINALIPSFQARLEELAAGEAIAPQESHEVAA